LFLREIAILNRLKPESESGKATRENGIGGMLLLMRASAACAALLLCATGAYAQLESKALLDLCNKLAANPLDTNRPDDADGTVASKIDPKVCHPGLRGGAQSRARRSAHRLSARTRLSREQGVRIGAPAL
jgi:hypothetical protein